MLLKKQIFPNGTQLGIWKIEENADFFLNIMQITENSLLKLEAMNERRKIEWLAARHLLQELLGKNAFCYSDAFGKPMLQDSERHLSISHSKGLVTVIVADETVGIDIQKYTPKIGRIAAKFMRSEELDCLDVVHYLEHLHIFWGAKEALYKAYGKKELDFKEHIFVESFDYLPKGEGRGMVVKAAYEQRFKIYFDTLESHVLVFVEEE